MVCSNCGGEQLPVSVPPELREFLPGKTAAVSVCRGCLSMEPTAEGAGADPDLTVLDDAMPGGEAGVPMVLLVGLLDSLATHRTEITALLERVERSGTDPLLVVDRLADSYGDDAAVDLARRRHQLEQLL